eukprot:TRINITY_DN44876_c0_g2_i1.p1 TRINITY_DN44876_c0_g2~~TRINITY_DN44876_c0_g2_i1.p1  ORF type:complete len:468 (+),score=87.19 TRINITY_DN44876_c0_g2_i1:78-1481(+)
MCIRDRYQRRVREIWLTKNGPHAAAIASGAAKMSDASELKPSPAATTEPAKTPMKPAPYYTTSQLSRSRSLSRAINRTRRLEIQSVSDSYDRTLRLEAFRESFELSPREERTLRRRSIFTEASVDEPKFASKWPAEKGINHEEAAQKERQLREEHMFTRIRERYTQLLTKGEVKSGINDPDVSIRGATYKLLSSPRTFREAKHARRGNIAESPRVPPPANKNYRPKWWRGRKIPGTARKAEPANPGYQATEPELPRSPKACDKWMAKMKRRCRETGLPADISKQVDSLRWRPCDMFTHTPPTTPHQPFRSNVYPSPPPTTAPPLRTLSARRRQAEMQADKAAFDLNKAGVLNEAYERFSYENNNCVDIPRLKMALQVLGVDNAAPGMKLLFAELQLMADKREYGMLSEVDFNNTTNLPWINKQIETQLWRSGGKVRQLYRRNFMEGTEASSFKHATASNAQVYTQSL